MDADTFSLRNVRKKRNKKKNACLGLVRGGNAERPNADIIKQRETVSNERYFLPARVLTIFMRLTIRNSARKLKMSTYRERARR